MEEHLKDCTYANTKPFIPHITKGKVIRVYDGDTFHIATLVEGNPARFSVRVRGLDTPELRTHDREEKRCGYFVRDFVNDEIMGKMVDLENISYDKYGRILATIFYKCGEERRCLNHLLLEKKYAVPYNGGTKMKVDWGEMIELLEI